MLPLAEKSGGQENKEVSHIISSRIFGLAISKQVDFGAFCKKSTLFCGFGLGVLYAA